jgi:hypothetical protein
MGGTVLTIMMLAGVGLLAGALFMAKRGAPRQKVVLMIIAAMVTFFNVAMWVVPMPDGQAPVEVVD